MGGESASAKVIDEAAAAKLLGWWLDSGVDVAVCETPRDWRRAAPAAPVAAKVSASPSTEAPTDLAAFRSWLDSAPDLPLARAGAKRVLPVGAEGAPLMLFADFPSAQDSAADRPIGGEAWALAQRMLAAIGIESEAAYVATLACFHTPGAKLTGDEIERCGQIARDHVRLAKPERLLLFGDAPARALISHPLTSARGRVHRVEGVRTVATFHPRWLLERPSDKALAWKDLLLLMSEEG